jgi:hypothetical protein
MYVKLLGEEYLLSDGAWLPRDEKNTSNLRLRVECTFVCKLQSRAQIHAVLVMGW